MKKNDRLDALQILLKLFQEKIPLSNLLRADKNITPLTKELCFGVCRQYFRLEEIARYLVKKPLKLNEVWIVLLMGLYQLQFMQKPDYAVVQETVNLLPLINKTWAKNFINAVLRRYCREKDNIVKTLENNKNYVYGHPSWMVNSLKKDWPSQWSDILKANDLHPPLFIRVNLKKITRDLYFEKLRSSNIPATLLTASKAGIRIQHPVKVEELPGFLEGLVSVQDESAQIAAYLMDLKPGMRVLDACCAPGGKTGHILETEPNLAEVVGIDLDERRLQRVNENLTRLSLRATLLTGDATNPASWWDGKLFDRILLDAPCSATGVIRRNPDIKCLRTEAEVETIVQLQNSLLKSLWPLLKTGGLLIYSTCSVLKKENEKQIASFVEEEFQASIVPIQDLNADNRGVGVQLLPASDGGDGFFYSIIKKNAS